MGLAYGLAFRGSLTVLGQGRALGRWALLAKIPVLILLLAGLARLGAGPLLAFPAGYLVYLLDLILGARRPRGSI